MFDAVAYTPMTTATKKIHHAHGWDGYPRHPGADVWFDKTFYLNISCIKIGHQRRRDIRRLLLIT